MSRTKNSASGVPEGLSAGTIAKAHRESAKNKRKARNASDGSGAGAGAGKRKRGPDPSQNASKRARQKDNVDGDGDRDENFEDSVLSIEDAGFASTSKQQPVNETANTTSSIFEGLESTHHVITMSIISSSNINKKVTRALELLSLYPVPEGEKQKVVMMYAKAPVVSKMISITEIVKREVAKGEGKWFQYTVVEEVMEESEAKIGGLWEGAKGEQCEEGEEDDEEPFETMKTPFERAIEGKLVVRATPIMKLYLSRARIDGLRKGYGEQTNALERKD